MCGGCSNPGGDNAIGPAATAVDEPAPVMPRGGGQGLAGGGGGAARCSIALMRSLIPWTASSTCAKVGAFARVPPEPAAAFARVPKLLAFAVVDTGKGTAGGPKAAFTEDARAPTPLRMLSRSLSPPRSMPRALLRG
eukprot:5937502-Amphidinium_carterae.2